MSDCSWRAQLRELAHVPYHSLTCAMSRDHAFLSHCHFCGHRPRCPGRHLQPPFGRGEGTFVLQAGARCASNSRTAIGGDFLRACSLLRSAPLRWRTCARREQIMLRPWTAFPSLSCALIRSRGIASAPSTRTSVVNAQEFTRTRVGMVCLEVTVI